MKKQSGFTLIELMVVMAIIAILATAGLAAYTGYIKKARDTTRIADLRALNTVVLTDMAADGLPPADAAALGVAILAQNNGKAIKDPLTTKTSCLPGTGTTLVVCEYYYRVCDAGTGYALMSSFESDSNRSSLYSENDSGGVADFPNVYYDVGSCASADSDSATF